MKKKAYSLVIVCVIFLFVFLGCRFYAHSKLNRYLVNQYPDYIDIGRVEYTHTKFHIGTRQITANALFDGIEFWIDMNGTVQDNFSSKYAEDKYRKDICSDEVNQYLYTIDVTLLDGPVVDIKSDDLLYRLEIGFHESVNTKNGFADAVDLVMKRLQATNHTNCDMLLAFATIDEEYMQITAYPQDNPSIENIRNSITKVILQD